VSGSTASGPGGVGSTVTPGNPRILKNLSHEPLNGKLALLVSEAERGGA
jgi:hypothetical protein